MRILVVGGGCREHILAQRLIQEGNVIFSAMRYRNPGIQRIAEEVLITDERKISDMVNFAERRRVEFVVVGPEDPLEAGIADSLISSGIPVFGPTASAARIESSKAFARELLKRNGIACSPEYAIFRDAQDAISYLRSREGRVVIKPSGLTSGKGVLIMGEQLSTKEEACDYVRRIFSEGIGGGEEVVIEEALEGEEFSLHALTDGRSMLAFPPVQDHKRAFEGDRGPNTGGMGSYSMEDHLLPFLSRKDVEEALSIMQRTVDALRREGSEFRGVLYGGFMLTRSGIRLLEFNSRFGDPEIMNLLTITEGDLCDALLSAAHGELKHSLSFRKVSTLCRYYVPMGYGEKPLQGAEVFVDEGCVRECGAALYYGSLLTDEGKLRTTKSRTLALVSAAPDIAVCSGVVERAGKCISGMLYSRKDIGTREEIERKKGWRELHDLPHGG